MKQAQKHTSLGTESSVKGAKLKIWHCYRLIPPKYWCQPIIERDFDRLTKQYGLYPTITRALAWKATCASRFPSSKRGPFTPFPAASRLTSIEIRERTPSASTKQHYTAPFVDPKAPSGPIMSLL
uniref:Uncharacterized protein n=1 Tax=Coccidioides posadasii RMSCC 3488 TaxID=454284 RepID=A0A0J6FBH0_COCPO|nr:hypothetical protein CPAG_06689 [Coccidioides posadasii RMSCC 3488]